MSTFIAQSNTSPHAVKFEAANKEEALALLAANGYADYTIVWTNEGTLRLNKVRVYDEKQF
jgi:hypothetical protein